MWQSPFLNYWPITRLKILYNHFWRHMGNVFTKELSIYNDVQNGTLSAYWNLYSILNYTFYVSFISRRKTMQLYHVHFIALLISYQQYLLKWVEGRCPAKEVHDPERRFAVFERRIIGMIKPSSQCSTAEDSSFASVARLTIFFFFVVGANKK